MRKVTDASYRNVEREEITALDILAASDCAEPPATFAIVTFFDAEESPYAERGQLAFWPEIRQAAIAWGGDAVWTAADCIEEAIQRYIKDDLIDA